MIHLPSSHLASSFVFQPIEQVIHASVPTATQNGLLDPRHTSKHPLPLRPSFPRDVMHNAIRRHPPIKPLSSRMIEMLLCVPLNPTFPVIERSVTDVDVTEDDHVAPLTQEGCNAGFEVMQKVELVRESGVVGLVRAVEVEDHKEAGCSSRMSIYLSSLALKPYRTARLTQNRVRRPCPPYPTSSHRRPSHPYYPSPRPRPRRHTPLSSPCPRRPACSTPNSHRAS